MPSTMTKRWTLLPGLLLCVACGSGAVGTVEKDQEPGADLPPSVEVVLPDGGGTDAPLLDLLPFDGLPPNDIPAPPGDFGKPCASNSDCESGFCLQISEDESVCTITCVEECPKEWLCKGMETPPDWVFVCVPPGSSYCSECQDESDCPYKGDRCLSVGETGSYCLADCSGGQPCPAHTECLAHPDGEPGEAFCQPTTGSCVCDHELNGTTQDCSVANEHGKCFGEQLCDGPAGWTPCDASVPAPESCDGFDENCNGEVDEGLESTPCSAANEFGECPGTRTCQGKNGWVCDAAVPEQETCDGKDNDCDGEIDEDYVALEEVCDGKDNDCDGLTDEGFPDTDEDDVANCVDPDDDNDGMPDGSDNCPLVENPGQADLDGDGLGDLCDPDIDGDGPGNEVDCAPYDGEVFPEAEEVCNGTDDNCNTQVDEGFPDTDQDQQANCMDPDDDGDGDPDLTDCAPLDPAIFTGAQEVCDGKDNNCDGLGDENCPAARWTLRVMQGVGTVGGEGGGAAVELPAATPGSTVSGEAVKLRWGW